MFPHITLEVSKFMCLNINLRTSNIEPPMCSSIKLDLPGWQPVSSTQSPVSLVHSESPIHLPLKLDCYIRWHGNYMNNIIWLIVWISYNLILYKLTIIWNNLVPNILYHNSVLLSVWGRTKQRQLLAYFLK